jgi:iron complex transport system ATP-binding protein
MILQATEISLAYANRQVLHAISLQLNPGDLIALIGPNGSGKSSLLKSLLGHVPTQGQILWNAKPLPDWRPRDLARVVAYLPQSPRHEPHQTVADIVRLGRASRWGAFGLESSDDQRITLDVARLLDLTELLDRPIDHLSGGQRQRAFIGRCLAQEPQALLLDEPNTFLDLKHQLDLWTLLRNLTQTRRLAILVASHELNLSAGFAQNMILLSEGKIAAEGSPDQVLRPEILSPVYSTPITRLGDPAHPLIIPSIPPE